MTKAEFTKAYSEHGAEFLRYAINLSREPQDAHDLLQESALRAFRACDRFEQGTDFKAWMTTIIRNTHITGYRRSRREITFTPNYELTPTSLVRTAVNNEVHSHFALGEIQRLLDELDPLYAVPFTMMYAGYRYHEIAEQLGVPIGTVKSRIRSARVKLRARLER